LLNNPDSPENLASFYALQNSPVPPQAPGTSCYVRGTIQGQFDAIRLFLGVLRSELEMLRESAADDPISVAGDKQLVKGDSKTTVLPLVGE
jgi:hypothetical protein